MSDSAATPVRDEDIVWDQFHFSDGGAEIIGGGPVPGQGPILDVRTNADGDVMATRANDQGEPRTYVCRPPKWERVMTDAEVQQQRVDRSKRYRAALEAAGLPRFDPGLFKGSGEG